MKTPAARILIVVATVALPAGNAAAQDAAGFPARSVRLVVPFSVGGASDIMARVASPRLTEAWGQQVIVDNRTGADGRIATEIVAKSVPDGYTLLVVEPAFVIAPGLFSKLPFDVNRDFTPVVLLGKAPQVFVVHPSFPARTVKEFIAIAKARPDDLNFASPGTGSAGHLAGEQLRTLARIQFVHIPYKGAAPALVDLLAGQASFAFVSVASALTNVKGGKLRALAVTTPERFAALPETPTLDEAGVKGFDTKQWWGVVAPSATPKPVITRLNADFVKAMNAPEARERVSTLGAEVTTTTVEAFGTYLAEETTKWGKIVRASGAKAD
ncbi:MAG: tripartite tricarboxylate transporter substrate binding protein [Burkholderiales bacterium]